MPYSHTGHIAGVCKAAASPGNGEETRSGSDGRLKMSISPRVCFVLSLFHPRDALLPSSFGQQTRLIGRFGPIPLYWPLAGSAGPSLGSPVSAVESLATAHRTRSYSMQGTRPRQRDLTEPGFGTTSHGRGLRSGIDLESLVYLPRLRCWPYGRISSRDGRFPDSRPRMLPGHPEYHVPVWNAPVDPTPCRGQCTSQ